MHVMDGALLTAKEYWPSRALTPVRTAWFQAQRFVFDEPASEWIGRFLRESPDLVLQNMDFAIPPYETVYIELDQTAAEKGVAASLKNPFSDRRGYLIMRGGDEILSTCRIGGRHAMLPFMLSLNSRRSETVGSDSADYEAWVNSMGHFLFGENVLDDAPFEQREELAQRFDWRAIIDLDDEESRQFMVAHTGDLGLVIASLLLLNQRRNVQIVDVPASRRLIGNKTWAYARHNKVSIGLDPGAAVHGAFRVEDRASPRRHAVRGHFAHWYISENCEHDWVALDGDDKRWACSKCGGRRVWRKPFHRGDAEKGYATKDYEVNG